MHHQLVNILSQIPILILYTIIQLLFLIPGILILYSSFIPGLPILTFPIALLGFFIANLLTYTVFAAIYSGDKYMCTLAEYCLYSIKASQITEWANKNKYKDIKNLSY